MTTDNHSNYIDLYRSGELNRRILQLEKISSDCTLCPRSCHVDRQKGGKGHCKISMFPTISSISPHFGEEPPLVGYRGSGTIFMTGCNLNCLYCQNFVISQLYQGQTISYEEMAYCMLNLQEKGCHNINFVTPTHQIYAIVKSLTVAIEKGLNIPLVYNSGGYDSIDTLQIIDGIFDIYMPDFKYWHSETGMRLSGISDYPEIAKKAIREMYHQVGDLEIDESGIAHRGLIVRHLILPGRSEESEKIIDFVTKLSNGIYMNLMDQYRPEYKAHEFEEMNRTIDREEYLRLVRYAESMGARLA